MLRYGRSKISPVRIICTQYTSTMCNARLRTRIRLCNYAVCMPVLRHVARRCITVSQTWINTGKICLGSYSTYMYRRTLITQLDVYCVLLLKRHHGTIIFRGYRLVQCGKNKHKRLKQWSTYFGYKHPITNPNGIIFHSIWYVYLRSTAPQLTKTVQRNINEQRIELPAHTCKQGTDLS